MVHPSLPDIVPTESATCLGAIVMVAVKRLTSTLAWTDAMPKLATTTTTVSVFAHTTQDRIPLRYRLLCQAVQRMLRRINLFYI